MDSFLSRQEELEVDGRDLHAAVDMSRLMMIMIPIGVSWRIDLGHTTERRKMHAEAEPLLLNSNGGHGFKRSDLNCRSEL